MIDTVSKINTNCKEKHICYMLIELSNMLDYSLCTMWISIQNISNMAADKVYIDLLINNIYLDRRYMY